MRFVNSFELSSILVQPRFCSSYRLGVMLGLGGVVVVEIVMWRRRHESGSGDSKVVVEAMVVVDVIMASGGMALAAVVCL